MAQKPKKHANPGRPFLISESDTDYLAHVPSKIVVGTSGTLVVELEGGDSDTVTLPAMGVPWTWEIETVVRVLAASTCSNIVGIT
jgi:hypothetical protein